MDRLRSRSPRPLLCTVPLRVVLVSRVGPPIVRIVSVSTAQKI
jgi:hypothetical protein